MGLGLRNSLANASAGTTNALIYLFDHYRAAEAASQRQGDQSGAFIVNLRRFATAPDLISESLLYGGRDHYEILEIDTEFQTFLDDSTILDLVGHIITTFRRGI